MRLWHALRTRLRSLLFRARRESDLREELQFHVERETDRLEAAGLSHDTARLQALRTFGGVGSTQEACRDARGLSLLDNAVRDVRFAWRSLWRTPVVALTIVVTVGLGLGLVAVVFTILNAYVFRVDEVRNPGELFGVSRQRTADDVFRGFTRAEYDALVRDTDVFSDTFASTPDINGYIEGSKREGRLVTGNFFQVLGVNAALGRTFTPADDEPGRPPVVVLSHRAWTQHFAGDPSLVGRTVLLNGSQTYVAGVMPEGFRGLDVIAAPDFWAPLSLRPRFGPIGERGTGPDFLNIVGRLRPGVSSDQARARLLVWDARRAAGRPADRAVTGLVLQQQSGTVPLTPQILLAFMPLFFAFGLILLIGCANVANLLLARGVARQREIGIRLAMGASRRRVVWQLLTEGLMLTLASAALGFVISRAVLVAVVYVAISTFPPEIGNLRLVVPSADWRVALFLVGGAMVTTLLFALAPALQATRVELLRAIRGEVVRDARPGRARDTLVALQVTGSALLLICAAVFLRSSWVAAKADPGIRTSDTLSVTILDEQKRGTILDVVRREPQVASVAASLPGVLGGIPALAGGANGTSNVTCQFVSPEYFGVLGIDLVRGRGFTPAERGAGTAVGVVSESIARQLWPGADAVGQELHIEPDTAATSRRTDDPVLPARTVVVVGVARDVAGLNLGGFTLPGAGVYLPTSGDEPRTSLVLRARGDAERARLALVNRLAAIDPNMGDVSTLRIFARAETYILAVPFWLTLVLGTLALLLTLSGLFSVLSYLVEQRTREIGVRMALGATTRSIAALVLSQSARPVGLGLLLGSGFTAAVGAVLLATPAAAQIGSSVRLFDPVAYAAGLLWIVVACAGASLVPALRATRIDPVGALRQD